MTQYSLRYSNLSQEEWRAVRSLADERYIVIRKTDKGTFVVVWDQWDHIKEAGKQVGDNTVYEERFFPSWLTQVINILRNLRVMLPFLYKELQYFKYGYKKACYLGKLYRLPKIHERLFDAQLFLIAEHLLIPSPSEPTPTGFWTIIFNLLCRMCYLT